MVESIAEIQKIWTTLVPERPFEFTFQDEQISKLYASEVKFQTLFSNFTFYCHTYCLSRIIWAVSIYRTTAHERNSYPKSSWCQRTGSYAIIIERIFETGAPRGCDSYPYCLVCNEGMVAKLCLSH